jgi:hypothetical protein
MNKLSKDKRDKLLLICIMAGGLVAVLYFLVIVDQKDELTGLTNRIAQMSDKRDKAAKTFKRQRDFEENLEGQKKLLNAKQAEMPRAGEGILWFNTLMEERRVVFNLDIKDIKGPEQPVDPGILPKFDFKGVAFTVTMVGTYLDFGRFLADFENRFPYMRTQLQSVTPEYVPPSATGANPASAGSDNEPLKLRFNFRVISLIKSQT